MRFGELCLASRRVLYPENACGGLLDLVRSAGLAVCSGRGGGRFVGLLRAWPSTMLG
jgi:hypothetical protein